MEDVHVNVAEHTLLEDAVGSGICSILICPEPTMSANLLALVTNLGALLNSIHAHHLFDTVSK